MKWEGFFWLNWLGGGWKEKKGIDRYGGDLDVEERSGRQAGKGEVREGKGGLWVNGDG